MQRAPKNAEQSDRMQDLELKCEKPPADSCVGTREIGKKLFTRNPGFVIVAEQQISDEQGPLYSEMTS